jgi:HD-GYP domain-containing protein (c-di-GMP phosphodiesterase class II)
MDVYDALSTRRSYKKAMKPFDALTLMKQKMGDHFDPKLLDSFIRLMGPDM